MRTDPVCRYDLNSYRIRGSEVSPFWVSSFCSNVYLLAAHGVTRSPAFQPCGQKKVNYGLAATDGVVKNVLLWKIVSAARKLNR